jgi:hypothetical protein
MCLRPPDVGAGVWSQCAWDQRRNRELDTRPFIGAQTASLKAVQGRSGDTDAE